MPRANKKSAGPGEGAADRAPAEPAAAADRTAPRARKGAPAARADEAAAGELRALFVELGREAEAQAQATREERAAVRREVAELRDQVRDSYHKALREALGGLEQVRAGAADVPAALRESLAAATESARDLARVLREAREEMAGLVRLQQHLRDQIAVTARDLKDTEARARAVRAGAGREVDALREQSRAAFLDFLRAALEGLERVRTEAHTAAGQLDAVRRLAREIEGPVGAAREASTVLQDLPRQAEESRQRVEEVLRRLAEAEETREPAEGHTRLGVTVRPGVVVGAVDAESPAAAAGVSPGDVIGAVNETAVHTAAGLRDEVLRVGDGERLVLRLTRGNVSQDVTVRLPPATPSEAPAEEHNRLGVTVEPGVVVEAVLPDSPAEVAGLGPGDVIGGVGGAPVHSGEELRAAVAALPEGAETTLRLTRGREASEVKVRLDEPAGE